MGLFSRGHSKDSDAEEIFDDADLPKSDDFDDTFFTPSDANQGSSAAATPSAPAPITPPAPAPQKTLSPAAQKPPASSGYGIEDAIELMRMLPKESNEVVVTVVKKTLESTHIQVEDIIHDAEVKEERLREQNKTLEKEIKDLQEQITQRNNRIDELQADLKETSNVRERLQLALEIESKKNQANTPTPPPTSTEKPTEIDNPPTPNTVDSFKEQSNTLKEQTAALKEQAAYIKERESALNRQTAAGYSSSAKKNPANRLSDRPERATGTPPPPRKS